MPINSDSERPLRIVIITETFLPGIDGVITRLCHTLRHLHRMGHTVHVVAPQGVEEFEGVPVHGVPGFRFPLYPDMKTAVPNLRLRRFLRAFRPDLIHAVNPALLGLYAFFASTSQRIPLIVSYHTHIPKYLRFYRVGSLEPLLWYGLRGSYNRADLKLATSQAMQEELKKNGIHDVKLWPRGVDTEMFHPTRRNLAMRTRLTQGRPEEKLILYLGRLSVEKEIERCRDILAAFPGVRLALVGDGPHRRKLEQYFAGTPTYFAGFFRGAEVAEAFASADVFFLPSRTETLGLVLLEAMAAGCPVVAPRAGGITDVVHEGVTGYLYNPDDPQGAIEAHRALLFDEAHREQVGKQARLEAEQWGWDAATRKLDEYYRSVMHMEQHLRPRIAERLKSSQSMDAICGDLGISRATYRRHARSLVEEVAGD